MFQARSQNCDFIVTWGGNNMTSINRLSVIAIFDVTEKSLLVTLLHFETLQYFYILDTLEYLFEPPTPLQ